MTCRRLLGTFVFGLALCVSDVRAGDWPQILGPARNGIAEGESLAATWPAGGPKKLWERPVGAGFAGVAVAGGKVVVFHRVGGDEVAECLDAATGKLFWKQAFPSRYASSIVEDNGPRCVPLIDNDRVFLYGAAGGLHCISLAGGKLLWSRPANKEFGAPEGYFGAGSSPILEGDRLLVNIGGDRQGAGIVAFSAATGETLWKSGDEQASYSSPVAATIDGVRHMIFITRYNALSLDPTNGNLRFRIPFGARGPTVNGANPVVFDGHLFLTSSYNIGCVLAKIGKEAAPIVRQDRDGLASQYPTPIYWKEHLYAVDGRQDAGVAKLCCLEPRSGKILWSQDDFGMAALIAAGGKLLAQKTDGELVLIDLSPGKYQQLAAAQIFNSTTRALPALAGGLYYARDDKTLKCIDLRTR